MKFTDGLWHRPYGHEFSGGVEVVDILNDGSTNGELDYLVATRHVAGRGDTLNGESSACGVVTVALISCDAGSLLTVNVSSPCDDIIKVR
jgi:hypothetical protein